MVYYQWEPAWIWTYLGSVDLEFGLFWGFRPVLGPILGGPDLDLGGTDLDLIFIWGLSLDLCLFRIVRTFTWSGRVWPGFGPISGLYLDVLPPKIKYCRCFLLLKNEMTVPFVTKSFYYSLP